MKNVLLAALSLVAVTGCGTVSSSSGSSSTNSSSSESPTLTPSNWFGISGKLHEYKYAGVGGFYLLDDMIKDKGQFYDVRAMGKPSINPAVVLTAQYTILPGGSIEETGSDSTIAGTAFATQHVVIPAGVNSGYSWSWADSSGGTTTDTILGATDVTLPNGKTYQRCLAIREVTPDAKNPSLNDTSMDYYAPNIGLVEITIQLPSQQSAHPIQYLIGIGNSVPSDQIPTDDTTPISNNS